MARYSKYHKLIEFALRRYMVPDARINHYNGLWGRCYARQVKSDWTRYEKGIFAACTVSVILFLLAFDLIIEFIQAGRPKENILQGN